MRSKYLLQNCVGAEIQRHSPCLKRHSSNAKRNLNSIAVTGSKGLNMKKTLTSAASFLALLALTTVASAQNVSTYAGFGYNPGYDYGYGYHASTYEEGVLRGWAALATGIGQGNYLNSLARINNEEARTKYMKNRQLAVETYFHIRQSSDAAREAMRPERLSTDQYVALARKEAPDRLSSQQYDTTLGRLHWPAALAGDEFAVERDALDQAFRSRSPGDVGPGTDFYAQVRQLTASMESILKANVSQLDPAQYVAAKKFIQGVAYESQQPLVARTLAAR